MVEHRICNAETAVRFCLGPQKLSEQCDGTKRGSGAFLNKKSPPRAENIKYKIKS